MTVPLRELFPPPDPPGPWRVVLSELALVALVYTLLLSLPRCVDAPSIHQSPTHQEVNP